METPEGKHIKGPVSAPPEVEEWKDGVRPDTMETGSLVAEKGSFHQAPTQKKGEKRGFDSPKGRWTVLQHHAGGL